MESAPISTTSKGITKKSKFVSDPESDKKFEELKRKYANAIAFLLVRNVPRLGLKEYFFASEENRRRFDTIKRLRAQIVEARPKARYGSTSPSILS